MTEQFFLDLSDQEIEAIEATDLLAANDDLFEANDLLDEPEWWGDAEQDI